MEHKQHLYIPGPAGRVEAVIQSVNPPVTRVGIICHPNPLQQGTMDNKVVTTIMRSFHTMGIAAVRFNYRGVGNSEGSYGDVVGEVGDCMAVVHWVQQQWPEAKLWLAGFSFGAYIAAKVATQVPTEQLISIAPAVDRMPYKTLPKVSCQWLIIQGDVDEVVIPNSVYTWFEGLDAQKKLVKFADTGHFFHGKLLELQSAIQNID